MRSIFALFVVFAFVGVVLCDDVVVLRESNFDSFLAEQEVTLVEFYAPWCGHCKRLEPEYAKAATALLKNDPPIKIAKVDATEEPALGTRFNVRGYPTLKVFKGGVETEYKGPRDAAGIVSYMKKQAGPVAVPLASKAALDKFIDGEDLSVVSFGESEDFKKVATKLSSKYRFGIVTDAAVTAAAGQAAGDIVLYHATRFVSKNDEAKIKFSSGFFSSDLEGFIEEHNLPLVSERNQDNNERFASKNKPIVTLFGKIDYTLDPKGSNYLANRLRKAAVDLRDKFVFAVANKDKLRGEVAEFGFTKDIGVAIRDANGDKFRFDGEFSVDAVREFLQKFVDGKLEKHVKSEDAPASNDEGVKVLTGRNFNDLVKRGDKFYFIEFYAPWCGHCKNLAPKWDALGEKFKGHPDVMIAKLNADANDFPSDFEVRGYPTIYYLEKGSSTPKKYEADRETEALVKFVNSKIGHEDL